MRTYIIAEAGVNHNGSLKMAKDLVDIAASAGADAVKFQTFKSENLVSKSAEKADYQKKLTDSSESQYEMLKRLELSEDNHKVLSEYCQDRNIEFLSTPFDSHSLNFLINSFNFNKIKVSSGDLTNAPFLLEIARTKKNIILSTGMSTLGEIEEALSVIAYGLLESTDSPSAQAFNQAYASEAGQQLLKKYVTLLHCTTEYPAPFDEINLNVMDTLRQAFGLQVGYSDHTEGIAVPIAAAAKGASIIEKHFTISKSMEGPDHKASLEPNELKEMIKSIRIIEKALGTATKFPTAAENGNKLVARKSIVAKRDINQDESFTEENITIKRPGTGESPFKYWDLLGKKATQNYSQDDVIKL